MNFHAPLIEGTLVKRYKRFMADIELAGGEVVTAHCANSGSMLSVREPGSRVWISPAANPDRKLKYTWEIIEVGGALVGINTAHPNAIVAEAIEAGKVPQLTGYDGLKREVKYGKNSRIDVLLTAEGKPDCYVEVKNVTMRRDPAGPAEFPDGVTARGTKHLGELADMVAQGHRAVMFYLVQRGDCPRATVAADIDPDYANALKSAVNSGVEIVCHACDLTPDGVWVADALPFDVP